MKSEEKSSVDFLQQILDLDHTHENYFLDVQSIFRELLSHHLDQDVRSMVIEEIIEIDVIPEDLQQVTRHIRDAHYLAQHEFDARELHEKLVGSVRELLKEEV